MKHLNSLSSRASEFALQLYTLLMMATGGDISTGLGSSQLLTVWVIKPRLKIDYYLQPIDRITTREEKEISW
jgi:hypothetical protein